MKFCYLSNNAVPSTVASSLQTVRVCEELSLAGNEVYLICPNSSKINVSPQNFYNLKNSFNILKINRFKKFPLGINYYIFSILSVIKSLKFKPDIYITRNFFTVLILILFRKKIILELHHGIEIESRITQFLLRKFNFLRSKKIYKFLAITNNVKNYYIKKFKINQDKVKISPSCTSLKTKFFFRRKKRRLNIGYFGSVYRSRGVDIILKLSKIDKKNNYYVYGDNKFYPNINLKNTNNNLKLMGYVQYKKIPMNISNMDILLMPYQSKITAAGDIGDITQFTSPLKLFDYLAAGKFIISTELPVLKEIIKDRKNVFFIKNQANIYAWKQAIDLACNQITRRQIVSKNNYNLGKLYSLKNKVKNYF